jgi:hypothetical protein
MIKMLNLLAEDEVLQKSWASLSGLQAILIFHRHPHITRQDSPLAIVLIELLQELLRRSWGATTEVRVGTARITAGIWATCHRDARECGEHCDEGSHG